MGIIDKYTSCPVGWEEPNAPIIDPAPPRTVTDNGDDSYNTNEKIVDVDDSYSTNEKIVDQSPPVTCGTPPAAKITKEEYGESYGEAFDLREEDNTGDDTNKY